MFYILLAISAIILPFVANAQSSNLTALIGALTNNNLTSLVESASSVNSTNVGQQLLSILNSNEPLTLFAPNNNAFTGVPQNISGNSTVLAEVLSYHVVFGSIAADANTFPNVTIGRTALNASDSDFLEGHKNQVLAWSKMSDGTISILNQNTPTTIINTTSFGNTTIHITNSVIDLPGELTAAIDANNLTSLSAALELAGLLETLNTEHGFTLFAPTNNAFGTALNGAGSSMTNETFLAEVLKNHIINGTTIYTSDLLTSITSNTDFISAGGSNITASANSTGTFVKSGNSTAHISTPDLILWNGVVHIVDSVLLNTQSNASVASSAFASATSAAAKETTETGPVGNTPSPTSSGAKPSNSSNSNAAYPAMHVNSGITAISALVCLIALL